MAQCNVNDLMRDASCFTCLSPGIWQVLELQLLCNILAAGGGGAGSIQVYEGRDPALPDDPTKAALSYPTGGGSLTQWDVPSQTWV